MRKVAAVVVMLGLTGGILSEGRVVATLADRLDLGAMQCSGQMTRAEPLCPLC